MHPPPNAPIREILYLEESGLGNLGADKVGVAVAGRTAILEVARALLVDLTGDADRAAAVGNTVRVLVDGGGLVGTSEASLVALTVDGNVLEVLGGKLLAVGLDGVEASLGLAGGLGRVVGVATSAVPVTGDGLGVKGDLDVEVLGNLFFILFIY